MTWGVKGKGNYLWSIIIKFLSVENNFYISVSKSCVEYNMILIKIISSCFKDSLFLETK